MSEITTKEAESPVDAVFVIGTGSKNNNEELRYALRNLAANCPFIRNVYISGECPGWIDTSVVRHLAWPDRFSHAKDANIIDKLLHACQEDGIADRILFCSDDQFTTRTCAWDDFAPRWLRRYTPSDRWYEERKRVWHTRLRQTLERDRKRRADAGLRAEDVFYYQPHMWMQIDREKFIEYASWSDYQHREDTIIASGYFNFADAGGQSNYDHVFISQNQTWPVAQTHVAYSDSSFNAAMHYLRTTLPSPCRFEKAFRANADAPARPSEDAQDGQNGRTDDEIIDTFTRTVRKETVWASLGPEIEEAERMRAAGFNGWRKVWNDLIRRWSLVTEKGKLLLPVPSAKGEEAREIVSRFRGVGSTAGDAAPNENTPAQTEKVGNPPESEPQKTKSGKGCPKCEEKRRRLREAAARRAAEARRGAEVAISENRTEKQSDDEMDCIDCAVEHLSSAAAYLGAHLERPTRLETELALGEVSVAAHHLLAARRTDEYNMCVRIADSVLTEESLLSARAVRDIINKLIG